MKRKLLFLLIILFITGFIATQATAMRAAPAAYNWLQFNGNAWHDGNNTQETQLTVDSISGLKLLASVTLPDSADGAPVYVSGVDTATGKQDVVIVTTRQGSVIALNALTLKIVWKVLRSAGGCHINDTKGACYTTSSPAVEPDLQFVYSYGLDGYVHKYQVSDGQEIKDNNWPELTTLKGGDEKESSALTIATSKQGTSYLYVSHAGYPGDHGDYQGHITTINLSNGSQHVFNTLCSNQSDTHFHYTPDLPDCKAVQSGVWARDGVTYDPQLDRIYGVTGNGDFDPAAYDWGDTLFALNADGTAPKGRPLDSYTPVEYKRLQQRDTDLGSTSPVILPIPPSAKTSILHLGAVVGKDGLLRLINLDNMSGQRGVGHIGGELGSVSVPQEGEVLPALATRVNPTDQSTWVFVANMSGIAGLKLSFNSHGLPTLQSQWQGTEGGTSPVIANGMLFYAHPNSLIVLDALTGKALWRTDTLGKIHWASPIVANGRVYLADRDRKLYVFGLP